MFSYQKSVEEQISPQKLKLLQEEKLRKQVQYMYQNSPLYASKLDEAGIHPMEIETLEDLQKLPFTEKFEIRKSQENATDLGSHQCTDSDKIIRIHSSSGTTGRPTYVGVTKKDSAVWTDIVSRVYYTAGIRSHHKVIFAMGLSFFVGGLPLKDGIENLGATFIPIGTGASERLVTTSLHLKPDVLLCTPSYANYLADYIRSIGMNPRDLGFKLIGTGGEPGGGLPEVKQRIEQDWGAHVFEAMGNADMAPVLFSECPAGAGMHFVAPDYVICELIDPDTGKVKPFENGSEGELVYSAIDRECVPLLRFRTRDLISVKTGKCSCGSTSFRIRCIGRTDDMLIIRGVNVFPTAIKDVVSSFYPRTTGDIQILLEQPGPAIDPPLQIKVEHGLNSEMDVPMLKKELEETLRAKLMFRANVQLVPEGTLPRFEMKTKYVKEIY
ncbi:phenylacetate--CoA ligase family protein [Bacillus timonensis]|uniref:phenylacetate--CoA ligase family protein n=1 Tax=Bacillus timonensis TaxID=1033734 RepID=UPI0002883CCF|nr:AMP-binding protein [Bacillus timonensis]